MTGVVQNVGLQWLISTSIVVNKRSKLVTGMVQDIGLQWLMDKGIVATEEGYPYQGVNNYCTAEGRDHIKFAVRPGEEGEGRHCLC